MRKFCLVFSFVILSMHMGCSSTYIIRYDGTYRGKVVDEQTNKAIKGAVVLGTWYRVDHADDRRDVSYFYDAYETTTDTDGEFAIPGQGLRLMTNLEPMEVLIFKAGYSHESALWQSLKKGVPSKGIQWDGNKPIFLLTKLTIENRKKRVAPIGIIPYNKQRLLIEEINKENEELGFPVYPEE